MLSLPKRKLKKETLAIRNPGERPIVVWLEPWADRFELAPNELLELVFVGPRGGAPEVLPKSEAILVYGWEGSEVFAFQNGRFAANQPTIDEIVRQEFEIAKENIRRLDTALHVNEIAMVQRSLDAEPELNRASQQSACDLAAYLTWELASTLEKSGRSTELLWQIARRIVGTKALALTVPDPDTKESISQRDTVGPPKELIRRNVISALPDSLSQRQSRRQNRAPTPRSAGSESGPTPH